MTTETANGSRRLRAPGKMFRHDMAVSLRSAWPALATGLLLLMVLVPVSTASISSVSVFNVDFTHNQLKYQFYAQDLAPVVDAACVVLGAVTAYALFGFTLKKRSTTAFFSINLTRRELYLSRACVGLVGLAVAVIVPFAVSLGVNVAALGLYEGELAAFAYVALGYTAVAAVSFAVATLAVIWSGTLFEAVAFTCALLGGVSAVLWGVGSLAEHLLVGNAMGASLYGQDAVVAPSLLESFSWTNPVTFFLTEGAQKQFFMAVDPVYFPEAGNAMLLVGWYVVYLALSVAGAFALEYRAGEHAEMAGASPVLSLVAVALYGIAAVSVALWLLGSIDIAVALVVALALFVLVSVVLLMGPLRGRTSLRVSAGCIVGEVVGMFAVVAVIYGGGLGYASYIPETADISSVKVSYTGSPSFLSEGFNGVSGGASYYCTSYRTYRGKDSINTVRSIQGQLIASARDAWATDQSDFDNTVVPYDIVIEYRLKDGGKVTRYYRQASVGELAAMQALDNDAHARVLQRAVVTGQTKGLGKSEAKKLAQSPAYNAFRSGALYVADGILNKIVPVDLTSEDRAGLERALADDLAGLDASDIYSPQGQTRAVLMFTTSPEADVSSFGYSFNNSLLYITDAWSETLGWLVSHGVMDELGGGAIDSRVIESLTFQKDDPYASVNEVTSPQARYFMGYRRETAGAFWVTQDFGAQKTVSDREQIESVLPNLRLGASMDGGYLVKAKLRDIEAYVYLYLPAALAPDYL